jgi:hypothetical protein
METTFAGGIAAFPERYAATQGVSELAEQQVSQRAARFVVSNGQASS